MTYFRLPHYKAFSSLKLMFCIVLLTWYGAGDSSLSANSSDIDKLRIDIFLGGLSGLQEIAHPWATTVFRSSKRGGLYIHYSATDPIVFGKFLPKIAVAFSGTGRSIAELSVFHRGFFTNEWKSHFLANGFSPDGAVVNIDTAPIAFSQLYADPALSKFRAFVVEGRRSAGLKVFAPIASPNSSGGIGVSGDATTVAIAHPWNTNWWNGVRAAAVFGGGIALDAPAAFYMHGLPDQAQQRAYQEFCQAVLIWAANMKLAAFVLVSPYFDNHAFLPDAKAEYASLAAHALPTSWVIENYNSCGPPFPRACVLSSDPAYGAPVGPESIGGTEASIADWFASSARTRER
jgi:hypothetical protein